MKPSTSLPLRYLAAAALAYVAAAAGAAWLAPELAGHYYQPRVVALTHTLTLGVVTMAIMGASLQLVPVVLERPLWSERLARWQFPAFVIGVTGMVAHFFIAEWSGLVWAAGLVGVACALHVLNVAMSMRGLRRRHLSAELMAIALGGLALTVVFGLALALDKRWAFMPPAFFPSLHAHLHLALLGWVVPTMLGVGARVYPMFLLAREPTGWAEAAQRWGLVAGVPAVVAGLLLERATLTSAGAVAVATAIAGHLVSLVEMARTRKRPRLDWGLRIVFAGAAFAPVAVLMGLGFAFGVLQGPRLALAYTVVVLGGWVSLTIVGMMLKVVPFLVWHRVYAPRVGRMPLPSVGELSWPRAERVACALLTTGTVALAVAVGAGDARWIRAAGLVLTAGALAFAAALGAPLRLLAARERAPRVEGPRLTLEERSA